MRKQKEYNVYTTIGVYTVKADNFTHAARLIATFLYGTADIIRVDRKRN